VVTAVIAAAATAEATAIDAPAAINAGRIIGHMLADESWTDTWNSGRDLAACSFVSEITNPYVLPALEVPPVRECVAEAASARSSLHFFKALAGKPTTP
jgi:hypothetical protein